MHLISTFLCKKKCKKVDQKTERAVCAKREPKEREREIMQKVD